MSETEYVLVDGKSLTPALIAGRLADLFGVTFESVGSNLVASLERGSWVGVDTNGWAPMDDSPDSGAEFRWEIAVNGGANEDSAALASRVYGLVENGTDWAIALYVDSEVIQRRAVQSAA